MVKKGIFDKKIRGLTAKEYFKVEQMDVLSGHLEGVYPEWLDAKSRDKSLIIREKLEEDAFSVLSKTKYGFPVSYFVPFVFSVEYGRSFMLRNDRNLNPTSRKGRELISMLKGVDSEDIHVWDGWVWRKTRLVHAVLQDWVLVWHGLLPCCLTDLVTSSRMLMAGFGFDSHFHYDYPGKTDTYGAPLCEIPLEIGVDLRKDLAIPSIPVYFSESVISLLCRVFGWDWSPDLSMGMYGVALYGSVGRVAEFRSDVRNDCYMDCVNWMLDELGVRKIEEFKQQKDEEE